MSRRERDIKSPNSYPTDSIENESLPNVPMNKNQFKSNIEDNGARYIYLPKLQQTEFDFFELVLNDDVDAVQKCLHMHHEINVNCTNFQGISPLNSAVQNRSESMVKLLLKQPNIEIGDAVLKAVQMSNMKILELLLNAQKKICPGLEFAGTTHSAEFPEHVTPLILAAHCDHYETIALLISRGHKITRCQPPSYKHVDCKNSLAYGDLLHAHSKRISVYRAISSPAYLINVSSDPILAAFHLTAELNANATVYRQFAAQYMKLRDDVSAFAVEFLGCCRTSEEVEFILKQTSGYHKRRHFPLPRLLMAMNYKQKEFVAHPNTQQVLESYWSGDWHRWQREMFVAKVFIVLCRFFVLPIIFVMCMITPRHRLVRHWQIPLNKLITHTSAYFVFLTLIFYISNQDKSAQKRGPPNTGAEAPLVLYVCGYTWSAIRMCLIQGPRRYFSKMWNWVEVIMLILFGLTFVFWMLAAVDIAINDDEDLERKYWKQHDPTLLAEGTLCLATIFAYFRLMFLCRLNYHLGPLQVSLGKMAIDIYKYIIIFTIIISAFAAGLARFYQYYDGMVYEDRFGMKTVQVSSFTSVTDTLNTLFWALFCMAPVESADVVLENTKNMTNIKKTLENRHAYTEHVGYFCFGCFEVISVIVVLNMLIATMSNTFQRVTDNVAIEWTFGRTELFIDYMMQTTLPPPYNMFPTAAGLTSIVEWLRTKVCKPPGAYARWSPSYCCYIERDVEASIQEYYPALMSVLTQRYFRRKLSSQANDGIKCELTTMRRELSSIKNNLGGQDVNNKNKNYLSNGSQL